MHLNKIEEKILKGEYGEERASALKLVVKIGELYNAEKLVKISSAQISGVSYKTMGDAGIEYLKMLSDKAEVSVLTTINPAGMDLKNWKKMGIITDKFRKNQIKITSYYEKLNIEPTYTCAPYLGDNVPSFGSHIAWAESSAIIYANSVLGARTNREGAPVALASAISGYTSYYGLHLKENRTPTDFFEIDKNVSDYSLLGAYIGDLVRNGVPYLKFGNVKTQELKNLGASMATWGSIGLYHIEGVTPEYKNYKYKNKKIYVTEEDLINFKNKRIESGSEPELIAFGCPHLSVTEIKRLNKLITGKTRKSTSPDVWICTSRYIAKKAAKELHSLEKLGAKVLKDTCMVVAPIERGYKTTAVNSMKASYYLPKKSFCNQRIIYGKDIDIVRQFL